MWTPLLAEVPSLSPRGLARKVRAGAQLAKKKMAPSAPRVWRLLLVAVMVAALSAPAVSAQALTPVLIPSGNVATDPVDVAALTAIKNSCSR